MSKNKINQLLSNYESLNKKLTNFLNNYGVKKKLAQTIKWLLIGIIALISFVMVFLLLERTPAQGEATRYIMAAILYLSLLGIIIKVLKEVVKKIQPINCAIEIENESDKFSSGLSSAAEFLKDIKGQSNTSTLMKKLTIANVAETIEQEDATKAFKKYSLKSHFITLAIIGLIFSSWAIISPMEIATGASRLFNPAAAILPWTTLEMHVSPKDVQIAIYDNITIKAKLSGYSTKPVILHLYEPDNPNSEIVEMYQDQNVGKNTDANEFIYTLTGLQKDLEYSVECDKLVSPKYKIKVIQRPEIESLQATLYKPSYIQKEPKLLPINTGDFSAIVGTKVNLSVTANQPLTKGGIYLGSGADSDLFLEQTIDGNSFNYEFTLATDTNYYIGLENQYEVKNEEQVIYSIVAKHDESPKVEIIKPGIDMPFPKTKMLEIKALAKDDYGVSTMILYYSIGNRKSLIPLNLKADFTPVAEFDVDFPWMLDTIPVQPGTDIKYFIQVEDNKEPRANVATTSTYLVKMPSMRDLYRGEEEQYKNIVQELQEFVEAQKDKREALMKAYEQIKHEEKLSFETEKSINEAIEKSKDQLDQAQDLLDGLKNLQKNLENNPFTSPDALEKMQKISEYLDDLLDDKTKAMMSELQNSLAEMQINPEDIEKYQEAFKMEDYIKELDRTLDLLSQVKEQQKYNNIAKSIEDLYERQAHIASQTEMLKEKIEKGELSDEELSELNDLQEQQKKISEELKDLEKQTSELAKNQEDTGQNPLLEDIKNIRDKIQNEDFSQRSSDIEQHLKDKNLEDAQKEQGSMLKFLENLKKDAMQINDTLSMGESSQLDLTDYIRRALEVSKNQETLLDKIEGMPGQFLRGQRPHIEGIIDSTSILQLLVNLHANDLEYDLEKLIKSSFSIDPSAIDAIRDTQRTLNKIVKDLEDRALEQARQDQRDIINSFNKLAIDLMKAQDNANEESSSSSMSALQQFKDLTRRQLSLYQQMMKQQMMPQSAEQLKRMALEQKHIRQALEQLLREKEGQMGTMGRMSDIIEDMLNVETEILDPELKKKVAEKQKSIYDRMLKAQKAIKNREEESDEREATKAKKTIHQEVVTEKIENIGSSTLDLSTDFMTDLREKYPESYKELLNDYFKSLNIYGGNE